MLQDNSVSHHTKKGRSILKDEIANKRLVKQNNDGGGDNSKPNEDKNNHNFKHSYDKDDVKQNQIQASQAQDNLMSDLSQSVQSLHGNMPLSKLLYLTEQFSVNWVSSQEQLSRLVEELRQCDRVALDTEFIKRNTYFPRLALIQLNTGKGIYLIDAPKLKLDEFWAVLKEIKLMVWHACGEDLSIFYLLSGCQPLTNIFDTQIALSYLSSQLQMGYQQAVDILLDIQLAKEESQSDWLQRPLTTEQEQYAIDDVRYLPSMYLVLEKKLSELGLFDKVWEDCQVYAQELYQSQCIDDEDVYLNMLDFRYSGQQMAVLRAVCAWREELARVTNQPRTFILKKQTVREIVFEQPTTIKQLAQKTHIRRSILRLYGDELLRVVQSAKEMDSCDYPKPITPPYRSKDKTLQKAVEKAITNFAQQIGVNETLIMRKKWLSTLYAIVALDKSLDELPDGLKGWRKSWVETTLIPIIYQHKPALLAGMGLANETDNVDN